MNRILTIYACSISILCIFAAASVCFHKIENRTFANSEKCDFSEYKTLRVKSLKIESLPQPEYPQKAKDRNLSGCVPVKILVDKDGEVSQACVPNKDDNLKDCKEPLNEEAFSRPAREAALKAKFDVRRVSLHEKDFFEMTIIYNFKPSAK